MSEQIPLQTELEYFEKHKQEYLNLHKGQFVLIKGEEFAGSFTTEAEAYKAGLEKFGNTPFFIKQVLDNDETASYPAHFTFPATNIEIDFSSVVGSDLSGQIINGQQLIALIGRDVLSLGILIYNGSLGTFSFSI